MTKISPFEAPFRSMAYSPATAPARGAGRDVNWVSSTINSASSTAAEYRRADTSNSAKPIFLSRHSRESRAFVGAFYEDI